MDLGYDELQQRQRGTLIEVHFADLHFGAFDPKTQYDILMEQAITKIERMPSIDIISIDGDTFDHKVMCNSNAAMYATKFVDYLVGLCARKNATLVILGGTYLHHYSNTP